MLNAINRVLKKTLAFKARTGRHDSSNLTLHLQDHADAEKLLAPANVDYEALHRYAYDAANFATGGKLPDLQFAENYAGRPDVAMFDFTCMYRAENASLVKERRGKKLLACLVGDCLVEVGGEIFYYAHSRWPDGETSPFIQ